MAKKETKTKKETIAPEVMAVEPVVDINAEKKVEKKVDKKPKWEIKDRTYFLTGNKKPLVRMFKAHDIYWFDEEKGYEREILATTNQKTVFVDEMEGVKRPQRIVFRDGVLTVPKERTVLQKILSIYHPKAEKSWTEWKPVQAAASEVENIEFELYALNAANSLELDMAEAVMRSIIGSQVAEMSSKELKRDLLVYAKRNPQLILDLIKDDNIYLRNIGIKATEQGFLNLSSDQRTFSMGSNNRKIMTVPFDEHPYSALAAWFKTDEGMEIYKGLEKRLA